MPWTLTSEAVTADVRHLVGGKAYRLARIEHLGRKTAPWICITTEAYDSYLDATGLRARIGLEINRKAFEKMR